MYRLALREKGTDWVAYLARIDTMEGAIELSRINMNLVNTFEDLKQGYMNFMQLVVTTILHDATGAIAEWPNPPQPAPEKERDL